jgi:hypothetical protein
MKIYTANLVNDDTATATIQMTKHEFAFMRKWMKTPAQFPSVKFINGVYLNYRSNGWYRVDASNTYRAIGKIQIALSIIRKIAREFEATQAMHAPATPVPSLPVPLVTVPIVQAPPVRTPIPVMHRNYKRPSPLLAALFARA